MSVIFSNNEKWQHNIYIYSCYCYCCKQKLSVRPAEWFLPLESSFQSPVQHFRTSQVLQVLLYESPEFKVVKRVRTPQFGL